MSAVLSPIQNAAPSAARVIAAVSPRDDVLSIGPVLPEDLGVLFAWLNDADAARDDFTWRPMDCGTFKDFVDNRINSATQLVFTLRLNHPLRAIGFVVFKNIHASYRSAELGVRIGQETDRSRGHGVRAARLALDYAWNTLNLHRVALTVFSDNPRATAAWRKAGFGHEGVMRHAAYTGGRWRDVNMMAVINPREAPDRSSIELME